MTLLGFRYARWYESCILKDEFNFHVNGSYTSNKDGYDKLANTIFNICIHFSEHFNNGKRPIWVHFLPDVLAAPIIHEREDNEVTFIMFHPNNGINVIPASLGSEGHRSAFSLDTLKYRDELDVFRRNVYHAIYVMEVEHFHDNGPGEISETNVYLKHCDWFRY